MPLQPAYTWSETETTIRIAIDSVPVKDASQLFCADRVVKLNAPPYLLLLDLAHAVDEEASSASIVRGRRLVIQLAKAQPGLWHNLTADGDAAEIRRVREESVARAHRKAAAAQQQRAARKQQDERAALDLRLSQERAQRDQLESLKQQELAQERCELQEWQQHLAPGSGTAAGAAAAGNPAQAADAGDESDYEDDDLQDASGHSNAASRSGSQVQQDGSSSHPAATDHPEYHGRGFWPDKERVAHAAVDSDSSRGSSCDAGAGSEDDSSSSVVTALNSCSDSNKGGATQQLLDDVIPCCSSSSTHLMLDSASAADAAGEPLLTVSSTSRARAARPALPHKQQQPVRLPAPVRSRAAPVAVGFTQLETPHLPAREQREVEIKGIKRHAGQDDSVGLTDRQPAFLKDKGDALAAQGNYRGALNAYSKALELDSSQAALWANRAAAHLALGQAGKCVQDCSAAIELVQALHTKLLEAPGSEAQAREVQASLLAKPLLPAAAGDQLPAAAAAVNGKSASSCTSDEAPAASAEQQPSSNAGSTSSRPAGHAPAQFAPAGSSHQADVAAQLQRQLVKLLARRAAAYVECHQLQEAQADLQAALRLDPGSKTLQADALEVAAALSPDGSSDPHSLKARADARLKAGDMHGAAEAYTAILQLLPPAAAVDAAAAGGGDDSSNSLAGMQDSQQQQQLRVAAVSNRAACWLSLNEYARCIEDCSSALAGILAPHASSQGGSDAVPLLLERHPPEVLLQLPVATAKSAARLVARLAAAHCCVKQLPAADAAYGWAAAAWAVLGEPSKAAAIACDQQRMQQLAVASKERGE